MNNTSQICTGITPPSPPLMKYVHPFDKPPSPSPAWSCCQVVVNLYPFRKTVTCSPPPAFEVGVENIDIGGPAMIRAAAKNHADVTVIVDPADYGTLLEKLKPGADPAEALAFRKQMAWKAFQHCASYDAQVGLWPGFRAYEQNGSQGLPATCHRPLWAGPGPPPQGSLHVAERCWGP